MLQVVALLRRQSRESTRGTTAFFGEEFRLDSGRISAGARSGARAGSVARRLCSAQPVRPIRPDTTIAGWLLLHGSELLEPGLQLAAALSQSLEALPSADFVRFFTFFWRNIYAGKRFGCSHQAGIYAMSQVPKNTVSRACTVSCSPACGRLAFHCTAKT